MSLAVYGNAVYDTIKVLCEEHKVGLPNLCSHAYCRSGGVANFCRAAATYGFHELVVETCLGADNIGALVRSELRKYCETDILYSPLPTSTAIIIVDKHECDRTSYIQWGACAHFKEWRPLKAEWHHLMYLDKLQLSPEFLQSLDGIVSVDISNSNTVEQYRDLFPYIDYLFVADQEHSRLKHINVRREIISHYSDRIIRIGKDSHTEVSVSPIPNLNVLGAGDYFTFFCIKDLLANGDMDLSAIQQQTAALLQLQTTNANYNPLTNSWESC